MALFRRKTPPPSDTIPAFWAWWTGDGAAACAAAIADGDAGRIADELSSRVAVIHPDLAWELAAGQVSEHALVVTAEGNPELRPIARRWLLAAPPADETWSYDDQRGATDDPEAVTIVLQDGPGRTEVPFGEVRVSARKVGTRFDVTVYHPVFVQLPENVRAQIAFLALDATLGENDTELWIGEIDTGTQPPIDGFGLLALRASVADLRHESIDEDGNPRWALLRGEGPHGPVVATARSPLHPLFGPTFTRHLAAEVPYSGQTEDGLADPASLDALRALGERLEGVLAVDGLLVAHESSAGVRTFHLYVDPETNAADRVAGVLDEWPDGDVRISATDDPGWESVRHLRG